MTGLSSLRKSFATWLAGESSSAAEDALSWQRALDPDQPGAPRDSACTWAEMAEMLKDLPVVGCHLMEFTNEVRVSARDTFSRREFPCQCSWSTLRCHHAAAHCRSSAFPVQASYAIRARPVADVPLVVVRKGSTLAEAKAACRGPPQAGRALHTSDAKPEGSAQTVAASVPTAGSTLVVGADAATAPAEGAQGATFSPLALPAAEVVAPAQSEPQNPVGSSSLQQPLPTDFDYCGPWFDIQPNQTVTLVAGLVAARQPVKDDRGRLAKGKVLKWDGSMLLEQVTILFVLSTLHGIQCCMLSHAARYPIRHGIP